MRGEVLKDITWVAKVEYKNYPDSEIVISAKEAPDILSAIAHINKHVRECWPYEIISLEQRINK